MDASEGRLTHEAAELIHFRKAYRQWYFRGDIGSLTAPGQEEDAAHADGYECFRVSLLLLQP